GGAIFIDEYAFAVRRLNSFDIRREVGRSYAQLIHIGSGQEAVVVITEFTFGSTALFDTANAVLTSSNKDHRFREGEFRWGVLYDGAQAAAEVAAIGPAPGFTLAVECAHQAVTSTELHNVEIG